MSVNVPPTSTPMRQGALNASFSVSDKDIGFGWLGSIGWQGKCAFSIYPRPTRISSAIH
jgi:hypothetical protein